MENFYQQYKVHVPEGVSGDYQVERFTVSEEDSERTKLRSIVTRSSWDYVPPGKYTRLLYWGEVVMSDTPSEIRSHLSFIHTAKGKVLIHGLGIGMCLQAVLNKPEVEHATVVEISPDVIKLVGGYYQAKYGSRLHIINADAMTWKPAPGSRWGAVWHDIWNDICPDNVEDMKLLHRRFGKRCDWQGSWSRSLLR